MASWLDEELSSSSQCLGLTFRCTPSESIGIWSVVVFYSTVFMATVVHSFLKNNHVESRRRISHNSHYGDELRMLCLLLVYFFTFAAGCLVWVLGGVRYVHPIQVWQVQLLGSAILMICSVLFIVVHMDLGESWSPIPEMLEGHKLVTTGLYAWARHPMYAVFLWAVIGTFLATLNWLIAWCVSSSVMLTLMRIPVEERYMFELFGREYAEYRSRVSPLGFPFVLGACWRQGDYVSL